MCLIFYPLNTPLAQLCYRQLCYRFVIFRHIFVILRHFFAKFGHIHFSKPAYTLRSYVTVFSACAVMLPFFFLPAQLCYRFFSCLRSYVAVFIGLRNSRNFDLSKLQPNLKLIKFLIHFLKNT